MSSVLVTNQGTIVVFAATGDLGTGPLSFPTQYVFDTVTDRDTYFANNPSELTAGRQVLVGNTVYIYNGSSWDAGTIVAVGPQGEKGDTGDTGPIGPEGPQGPQGESGTDKNAIPKIQALSYYESEAGISVNGQMITLNGVDTSTKFYSPNGFDSDGNRQFISGTMPSGAWNVGSYSLGLSPDINCSVFWSIMDNTYKWYSNFYVKESPLEAALKFSASQDIYFFYNRNKLFTWNPNQPLIDSSNVNASNYYIGERFAGNPASGSSNIVETDRYVAYVYAEYPANKNYGVTYVDKNSGQQFRVLLPNSLYTIGDRLNITSVAPIKNSDDFLIAINAMDAMGDNVHGDIFRVYFHGKNDDGTLTIESLFHQEFIVPSQSELLYITVDHTWEALDYPRYTISYISVYDSTRISLSCWCTSDLGNAPFQATAIMNVPTSIYKDQIKVSQYGDKVLNVYGSSGINAAAFIVRDLTATDITNNFFTYIDPDTTPGYANVVTCTMMGFLICVYNIGTASTKLVLLSSTDGSVVSTNTISNCVIANSINFDVVGEAPGMYFGLDNSGKKIVGVYVVNNNINYTIANITSSYGYLSSQYWSPNSICLVDFKLYGIYSDSSNVGPFITVLFPMTEKPSTHLFDIDIQQYTRISGIIRNFNRYVVSRDELENSIDDIKIDINWLKHNVKDTPTIPFPNPVLNDQKYLRSVGGRLVYAEVEDPASMSDVVIRSIVPLLTNAGSIVSINTPVTVKLADGRDTDEKPLSFEFSLPAIVSVDTTGYFGETLIGYSVTNGEGFAVKKSEFIDVFNANDPKIGLTTQMFYSVSDNRYFSKALITTFNSFGFTPSASQTFQNSSYYNDGTNEIFMIVDGTTGVRFQDITNSVTNQVTSNLSNGRACLIINPNLFVTTGYQNAIRYGVSMTANINSSANLAGTGYCTGKGLWYTPSNTKMYCAWDDNTAFGLSAATVAANATTIPALTAQTLPGAITNFSVANILDLGSGNNVGVLYDNTAAAPVFINLSSTANTWVVCSGTLPVALTRITNAIVLDNGNVLAFGQNGYAYEFTFSFTGGQGSFVLVHEYALPSAIVVSGSYINPVNNMLAVVTTLGRIFRVEQSDLTVWAEVAGINYGATPAAPALPLTNQIYYYGNNIYVRVQATGVTGNAAIGAIADSGFNENSLFIYGEVKINSSGQITYIKDRSVVRGFDEYYVDLMIRNRIADLEIDALPPQNTTTAGQSLVSNGNQAEWINPIIGTINEIED